ncbi:MAG: RdgB/HAM1 family non-canonical purine NTP pyrophosphatase [Anaerolineales bacterium]
MLKLLLGTDNLGKQDELRALLDSPDWELVVPQDLQLELDIEETGATYAENARLKAVAYATQSGLWSLSDDSGLEVEVLNGAPGLRSARLAGVGRSDADRRRVLLGMLADYPRPWVARFRSTVVLANPSGEVDLAEGKCAGEIIPEERGTGGFGYDAIFLVRGTGKTMAELEMEEKNQLSHRARAVQAIRLALELHLGIVSAS